MSDGDHPLIVGIRWILENRTDANGKRFSKRSLSLAAGLTHSHIGQILSGYVRPESVQLDTVRKIATVGRVAPEWLMDGRVTDAPEPDAPAYPNLEAAALQIQESIDRHDVDEARSLRSPRDYDVATWRTILLDTHAQRKAARTPPSSSGGSGSAGKEPARKRG